MEGITEIFCGKLEVSSFDVTFISNYFQFVWFRRMILDSWMIVLSRYEGVKLAKELLFGYSVFSSVQNGTIESRIEDTDKYYPSGE